jgi:UDP-N-acetylglucosamine 2-epimerase (non-hydrolysing)
MASFGLVFDADLNLMRDDQRIGEFAARAMAALTELFVTASPDVVLIQGDTTTVLCAALAAFWLGIPLGDVEAGLRSHDRQQPFPEELNREVAGLAARFHFAPTTRARDNLLRQGVDPASVFVTGNTIVDALETLELDGTLSLPALRSVDFDRRRVILVTAHRRESHGRPLVSICAAVRTLTERFDDTEVIFPVHLNPRVQTVVREQLGGRPRVLLTDPLSYDDLLRVMRRSFLILTDSGGIQEEAPSFHKPALVLRDVTERPEAVDAGLAKLVGTDAERIVGAATQLLTSSDQYAAMTNGTNPFGDGRAGERIAAILARHLESGGGMAP